MPSRLLARTGASPGACADALGDPAWVPRATRAWLRLGPACARAVRPTAPRWSIARRAASATYASHTGSPSHDRPVRASDAAVTRRRQRHRGRSGARDGNRPRPKADRRRRRPPHRGRPRWLRLASGGCPASRHRAAGCGPPRSARAGWPETPASTAAAHPDHPRARRADLPDRGKSGAIDGGSACSRASTSAMRAGARGGRSPVPSTKLLTKYAGTRASSIERGRGTGNPAPRREASRSCSRCTSGPAGEPLAVAPGSRTTTRLAAPPGR